MLPRVVCVFVLGNILFGQTAPSDGTVRALASKLFQAANAPERTAILDRDPGLLTPALVKAMNELAGEVFDRRDYTHARSMYEAACEVATRIQDRHGYAVCTYDQGLAEMRLMRSDDARKHVEASIPLYEELKEFDGLVKALNLMASLVRSTGDYRGALPYYQRALAAGGGDIAIAQTNTNLAIALLRMGNIQGAIDALQKALTITRARGMERESAMVLTNLGSAYYEQGDLELARVHSEQALSIKEKSGDPGELGTALLNLGVIQESAGNPTGAREYFDRALKLTQEPSLLPLRLLVMYNYGNLLFHAGDDQRCREILEQTVELAEKAGGTPDAANARVALARLAIRQHRFQDAGDLARTATAFGRWSGQAQVIAEALDTQGVALLDLGRLDEAQTAFEQAIGEIEGMRAHLPGEQEGSARFMEGRREPFLHMVRLQLDRGNTEAALAYVERSRARSLLDTLKLGNPALTKSMTAEESEQERALARRIEQGREAVLRQSRQPNADKKRLNELSAQLDAARAEYRSFETALYAAHPRLQVERAAFEPVRPQDLVAALPDPKAALLEYSVTDTGVILFVMTRREAPVRAEVRAYRLSKDTQALQRDITRLRDQIATRDLGYRALAGTVYSQLIGPASEQLKGRITLIVSPDSFLWDVPFQALTGADGRSLLEDHPVFYTPSLTVLYESHRSRPRVSDVAGGVLAVRAVDLPSARREIEGMQQVYGPARVEVLDGAAADNRAVVREAPKFDVLHVSAHGVFNNRNPLNSYLLLAKNGKPEAGVLEAREWMDLSLRARLAVLSGCETGRGEASGGEGLLGMSWALFIAGTPTTVASQWKVESESTSRLMLAFHRSAQSKGKAAALRDAALAVMKTPEWRHPFYWSAFVLVGDGF